MNTTAGDLLARDLACEWLQMAGRDYDIAVAPPYTGGLDWKTARPENYSDVLFVCGPFRKNEYTLAFLEHFAGRNVIGLNLSMLDPIEAWNPFDLLIERDSTACSRPDITFLSNEPHVPVVGVVLVHPQPQYKERAMHSLAHDAIRRLIASRDVAAVAIDTCLDKNAGGLRTPSQVESLIARMDLVVTTRLHGTVLPIKNGVPALPVDPIAGGAKIARQVQKIGWPVLHTADALSDDELQKSFDFCLSESARQEATKCRDRAANAVRAIRDEFIASFSHQAPSMR